MRYLGIDYGSRKVGLALSDENGTMGFPHGIVANAPELLATVRTLIKNEQVGAVVIGESRTLEGGDNAIAKEARAFGARLTEEADVPVHFEDETFTSAEARRSLAHEAKSRAPRDHSDVDASAAALILTSYLSRTHG